jgi:hypothetical protein
MAAQGRSGFAWDLRQLGNPTVPGERNGKVWKRMEKKLPLGIQSFEGLRKDGYTYVDKTGTIFDLVHGGTPYFLSRPRRFGKSLLLSTMKAYWEGKKELFAGLRIEKLEEGNPEAFIPHPVFSFDFCGENYLETPIEKV